VISSLSRFSAPARAGTWWEFKTPVFLGVVYLSATVDAVPFARVWPTLLLFLAAFVPLAAFVCVINDMTDLADDLKAGKVNRLAGRSDVFKLCWLGGCLAAGSVAAMLCFRGNAPALAVYLANWLAFAAYSLPPLRLKQRGFPGVVADACGGMLLPALWSALLLKAPLPPLFLALLAIWSFTFGLRGILYHQLGDVDSDRLAGTRTLVVRMGADRVARLVACVFFPAEVVSLSFLLWMAGSIFVLPLLAAYALGQMSLWRWLRISTVLIRPKPRSRLALLRYYQLWFPLTFILALSLHNPWALVLVPLHAVLFPDTWRRFGQHRQDIRHNLRYPPDWNDLNSATR